MCNDLCVALHGEFLVVVGIRIGLCVPPSALARLALVLAVWLRVRVIGIRIDGVCDHWMFALNRGDV